MKFKLKSGGHRADGISSRPGDIVESEHDLAEAYGEKFERVPDEVPATEDKQDEKKKCNVPDDPPQKLVAVHKGAGRWDVVRADTDEKVNSVLLSREDAEAMAGKRK